MEIKERCVSCGGSLTRGIKKCSYSYAKRCVVVDQLGLWCNECDDGIFNGDDLQSTSEDIEKALRIGRYRGS